MQLILPYCRDRVTELKNELKEAKEDLREALKTSPITTRSSIGSNNSNSLAPPPFQTHSLVIPLNPPQEQASDYPDVIFWKLEEWKTHQHRSKERNGRTSRYGYLCDESGTPITDKRAEEMYASAVRCFNQLFFERLDPRTWSKKTDQAWQYFRASMRAEFIEFRLADGDWKLQEFATVRFPDWSRWHRESGGLGRESIFYFQSCVVICIQFSRTSSINWRETKIRW